MPVGDCPRTCISIHDVAPGTWDACRRLLDLVDSFGRVPVTLLVVPDYHHQGRIDRCPEFLRAIERRLAQGDEVALHGYYHLDEASPPRKPVDWIRRRILTRAEGEFSALPFEPARKRIQQGLSMMNALGWAVRGFVAPAWLMGEPARRAIGRFNLDYTTTRLGLYRLPDWHFVRAPSLVYSAGARWRQVMSETLNWSVLPFARRMEVLRLSLHPVDAGSTRSMQHWSRVIASTLSTHSPITKSAWARLALPMGDHRARAA